MNILILNWRDIKNPQAGGAEQLTHEVAKRWVKLGNKVMQISANFSGGNRKEIIDGVQIIRLGRWWSVHILAYLYYYRKNLRGKVDVIIDEVHWFPFFARLYARNKTVLLACEVANNLFKQILPWPLSVLARMMEILYLRLYRNVPVLAISPSTKEALIKEGFRGADIVVLPMGITLPGNKGMADYRKFPKEKNPTLIYLGRINKQKGASDAIEALRLVKHKIPKAKLWFVGNGKKEYLQNIKQQITNRKLEKSVVFYGYVDEESKFELLARAHILIVPSIHEGWGLIVPEAGIVGTPAVVYNVAGLKDLINNRVNGLLVEQNPNKMAAALIDLLTDKQKLAKISQSAIQEAKNYNWERTAKVFYETLTFHQRF